MKWIEIRSREWATQYHPDAPWAAISIATEAYTWPRLETQNRIGLLQLDFVDISNPDILMTIVPARVFNKVQASSILDFVDLHWQKATSFLIHCESGHSRSSAVAAAIMYIRYGQRAARYFFDNERPNRLVYNILLKQYYDPDNIMV